MNAFANALLDSSRAAAAVGPNDQHAVRRKPVDQAEAQRQLGSDDGQDRLLAARQRDAGRPASSTEPRRQSRRRSNTRVSRARTSSPTSRSADSAGDERVLARAAADDENSHDLNGLGVRRGRATARDRQGLFR